MRETNYKHYRDKYTTGYDGLCCHIYVGAWIRFVQRITAFAH